jgi:hypothetical protein
MHLVFAEVEHRQERVSVVGASHLDTCAQGRLPHQEGRELAHSHGIGGVRLQQHLPNGHVVVGRRVVKLKVHVQDQL